MANTIIQVKRSIATTKPTDGSLSTGEPAYSYSSNVMFVGTSDGSGVLAIGGNFYVNRTNSALEIAQAAYAAANSAGSSESLGNIYTQANNAYDKANSANVVASSAFDKANSVEFIADAGYDKANSANILAYESGLIGSASYIFANSAHVTANAAYNKANSAETIAIAAYANSNTKFASSGGTITGDVAITGNLTITGNVYSQDTETLRVSDPLIYLAGNNYVSDIVDIGFIANYVNATGSNVHTGLYREHEDKQYYLFQGYDAEPINNHIGAFSNNMTLAVLNADIKTSNLVLGGQNTITWITAAYGQANAGTLVASAAFDKANTANVNAADASFLTTGIVAVGVGGTGVTSFTSNGILYGNTGGPLKVTSAGTEGQVLQAGATGVPSFGMLDGGTF